MHKVYDRWPEIARKNYFSDLSQIEFTKCPHIVFAGMGGSGAIGDIFSAILSKTSTHVTVVKGYHLPKTVTNNSVVVVISISGNTVETISMLKNAIEINSKIIVFSDGGKIKDICNEKNIPHRNIKKYHSPRASFTSFLYSMLHVLKPIIPIEEKDIIESIKELENMSIKINSKKISKENPSIQISEWIKDTPVIYYPWGLEPVAIRFKNSLQENSKIQAVIEDVIESCHNGIVTWDKQNNFQPILIRGQKDYEKTKERWEILKEFFSEKKIDYKEIISENGNILTKIICLIYLLDYASIYLAIKLKVDPTPVNAIEYIKNKLN
ncbi:glucose-6-phosphate isomerase [Nitrosopumilus oxyclinae]|uniref:Glucose-6-phosphate isomerase n=2 Tax=Nitrosopumilus oxyclinae TaxID=1959104 RepID=A0A7D5M2X3_9ARCH|nr:glucose-6-phosphate isomerase [Nitrosopumilus oxyclinae]